MSGYTVAGRTFCPSSHPNQKSGLKQNQVSSSVTDETELIYKFGVTVTGGVLGRAIK